MPKRTDEPSSSSTEPDKRSSKAKKSVDPATAAATYRRGQKDARRVVRERRT
ncbi:hypothetical protein [Streptomyces nigrescens]|uniref:hypothetical protein n=1 Tax=Streptomyces nigrescens TaxID=1920 RepID=UPI0036FC2867